MLTARSRPDLMQLREELMADSTDGQEAHVVSVDLTEPDGVDRIMTESHRVWDKLDVLVNNAAVLGPIGEAWESDWEEWEHTVAVNLLAPIQLCLACVRWMSERRSGKIVNVSGGGAADPRPNFAAYATTKAAIVRFSESLAHGVSHLNIQVNCVTPGVMRTQMLQRVIEAGPERVGDVAAHSNYLKLTDSPEVTEGRLQRAADLCVLLASSASDGITGRLISAERDPWESIADHRSELADGDIYTLRLIVPEDRGKDWGAPSGSTS